VSELKQIVVERGVITFDGQVIPELAELLDAIRAAVPNLEAS
jgi:hypothetical protein